MIQGMWRVIIRLSQYLTFRFHCLILFELNSLSNRWQEAAARFLSRTFCLARPIVIDYQRVF